MAFNGSGVFNRIHNWVTDKGNSVPITASRMDTEMDGFATGLSNCLTKDGQTTATQSIPFALGATFGATIAPTASDGAALGSATKHFSDLFLALGGVINWNNGDVTITHAANALAFGGAANGYTFSAVISPAASDGAALGSSTLMWSDLFLASGAVVNWNNGDVTLTHSADTLAFAGGTAYNYDAVVTVTNTQSGSATISGFVIDRNSASPDVSDFIGRLVYQGRSSTGVTVSYAEIDSQITDHTNGSEDARIIHRVRVAGSMTDRLTIDQTGVKASGLFGFGAPTSVTIASDAITVTSSHVIVDTESAAASDNLLTINGGADGDILVLRSANSARDVVVTATSGNIDMAGGANFTLATVRDRLTLMYEGTASRWREISRSTN